MGTQGGPEYPCIQEGLVFCFDPANPKSAPSISGNTTTVYNMVNNASGSTSFSAPSADEWDYARSDEGYIQYDGTDDLISIADTGVPMGDSARTVSVWANWVNKNQYASAIIYGTAVGSGTCALNLSNDPNNYFKASFWANEFDSTVSPSLDTWYNVTFTYEGGTDGAVELFVNGSSILTGTKTLNTTSTGNGVAFGSFYVGYTYDFEGKIGPGYIYNRALS